MNTPRNPPRAARRALAGLVALLSIPLLGASPAPSASLSAGAPAGPPVDVLSAAAFTDSKAPRPDYSKGPSSVDDYVAPTRAPTPEEWKGAARLSGVRMGREAIDHGCVVEHIREWVRVRCPDLATARVDLVAGEKRDFSIFVPETSPHYLGENMQAVFSMHLGDRRVVQWLASDEWMEVWGRPGDLMASGARVIGPMFGAVLQVDWSRREPKMSLF